VASLLQRPHAAICSARCGTDAPLIACNRGRPAGAVITPVVSYDTVEHNIKVSFCCWRILSAVRAMW